MSGGADEQRELWRRADRVLDELLILAPVDRLSSLEARGLEPEVEQLVRRLLDAGQVEGGLLDRPVDQLLADSGTAGEIESLVGRRCGPFELEQEIGRGGMAVVFRAKRVDGGFHQQVALKVLTIAHLVSSDRVGQEKDILARLSHPHIATLVDGGVAADGTSWLAMELVDGEPIDRFCRRSGLDARGLVELFLDVCDAVAYAHRNLVVHRDLKPGNIMVDTDGKVRLLDFGIAKLLDESDPGATHTRVFTPRYAAPEQLSGEPVTTATDVFGLGGVLHRLLTGEAPWAEDREPSAATDTAAARARPSQASAPVTGIDRDLDTVVLKALRDEPDRRYPSATELRDDLERWLQRRPVRAVPDSLGYRARKLVERHRTIVASAVVVLLAVLAGTAATWWQAARARQQAEVAVREAERATAVTDFLLDLFQFAEPDRSQGETLTVRQTLDAGAQQLQSRLEDQPEVRVELLGTVGEIYRRLGLFDEAVPLLDAAARLGDDLGGEAAVQARLRRAALALSRYDLPAAEADIQTALTADDPHIRSAGLQALAAVRRAEGRKVEATEIYEQSLAIEAATTDPERERIVQIRLALADVAYEAGELDRAGELYRVAHDETRATHEGDHTQVALVLQSMGIYASETGDPESALEYLEEALAMRERLLGSSHPDVAFTLVQIAQVHRTSGHLDEAEARYRHALELQQESLGEDHRTVLSTLNSLAILAYDRGHAEQGAELLDEVVNRSRRSYGERHPVLAEFLVNLAAMRRVLGQLDVAEGHLLEALSINRETVGPETLTVGHTYAHLGNLEQARGDLARAEDYFKKALAAIRAATDEAHPETLSVRANLASVAFSRGQYRASAEQFEQAFAVTQATLQEGHPIRIVIEARFARSLARAGRGGEAAVHGRQALEAASAIYPEDHPRLLEVKAAYGGALMAAGKTTDGERVLHEVKALLESGAASRYAADEVSHWLQDSNL